MALHSGAWEGADKLQSKRHVTTYGTQVQNTINTMEEPEVVAYAAMHKKTGDTSYRAGHYTRT
jgi:hypothetical protein